MVRQWRLALWHFATLAHLSTRLPHALKRLLTSTLLPTRFRGTTASKKITHKRDCHCATEARNTVAMSPIESKFFFLSFSFFPYTFCRLLFTLSLCPSPTTTNSPPIRWTCFWATLAWTYQKKALHCTLTSRSETRIKGVWCPLAGVPLVESGTNTEYAFVLRCLRA